MAVEANKALLHRWIEDVWNTGNLVPVDEIFAPSYSVNGEFVGPDGVKDAVRWLHTTFSDAVLTIDDMIAENDKIVVSWVMRGIQRGEFMDISATHKEVMLAGINIYRVEDGKIVANTERVDVLGLLMQLGPGLGREDRTSLAECARCDPARSPNLYHLSYEEPACPGSRGASIPVSATGSP